MAKYKSRATRFENARDNISDAKIDIEELHDELSAWYENMPENLQDGEKGCQLEEAIMNLEDVISLLLDVEYAEVDFPTMFS